MRKRCSNSWVTKKDREEAGFFDASLWEKTKKEGELAIKRLINSALVGTSVTAVLIGRETYLRRWVRYELVKSFEKGNGLLGICIHNIPDKYGQIDLQGPNPFEYLYFEVDPVRDCVYISERVASGWRRHPDVPSVTIGSLGYEFLKKKQAGYFGEVFDTYDWVVDGGYDNVGMWVERAARQAGR